MPFNVLRGMDLAGGTLSYEGVEVIRKVESDGKKYFRGIFPLTAELKRMAAKIKWFAKGKCPFILRKMSQGEAI